MFQAVQGFQLSLSSSLWLVGEVGIPRPFQILFLVWAGLLSGMGGASFLLCTCVAGVGGAFGWSSEHEVGQKTNLFFS